jgi:hypothetical protein
MRSRAHWATQLAAVAAAVVGVSQAASAKNYAALNGRMVMLPERDGVLDKPATSPDGRLVAYVRAVGKSADQGDPQPTEVVVADLMTGKSKVLVQAGVGTEWYLRPIIRVTFAEDGKHIFAERTYPGTSSSVHEIDLATGKERQFAWGVDIAVLRDGPWRGDLIMGVHTCYRSHPGCDYPAHVVTPLGKSVYVVPQRYGSDGVSGVQYWLSKRGWRAW